MRRERSWTSTDDIVMGCGYLGLLGRGHFGMMTVQDNVSSSGKMLKHEHVKEMENNYRNTLPFLSFQTIRAQ